MSPVPSSSKGPAPGIAVAFELARALAEVVVLPVRFAAFTLRRRRLLAAFRELLAEDPAPIEEPPEAALPNWIEGIDDPRAMIAAAAQGAQVALGLVRPDADGVYNALLRLGPGGEVEGVYDKHHLVPFGEFMPFESLFSRFGITGLADVIGGGMQAGPGPAILGFGPIGRALPLICYEAVFPQDVNGAGSRPDFLLQITNDAWFGTRSGPYQHLAQARMRAIEQGLPLVRAANTGISAVIDPWGRTVTSIPLGEPGYADAVLPAPRAPTFYSRTGDKPAAFGLIVLLLALTIARILRNGLTASRLPRNR